MIDPRTQSELKRAIAECIDMDRSILDALRTEIAPLKPQVRRIQPRTTTSISLVGTDGGNNQLQFDPFLIQLIRVVDSSNNEGDEAATLDTFQLQDADPAQRRYG